jgi:hypothetical protein
MSPGMVREPMKGAKKKKSNVKSLLLPLIPVALILLIIIILPHIDLRSVKATIAKEASSRLKGEVVIARASFALLPSPHFALRGVQIEAPQWGNFTSQEIRIYPRLLSLVQGKIVVKSLFARGPILDLVLHKETLEQGKDIFSYIDQKVIRMAPSLELEGGELHLLRPEENKPFFTARGLRGDMASSNTGDVRLDLRFSSPCAEGIEVQVATLTKDKKGKSCTLLVAGRGVQVEKVRGFILEYLGKNEAIQEVFRIVQGGELSRITFQGEGKSFAEALDFERNMKIRGTFAHALIMAPPAPFPLEEVSGEFEIAEAVLRCWNVDLRLGKSTASKGKLVVGLIAKREDFHLDLVMDAAAEDLVRYLPMVLKEKGLKKEIESFREVRGRGQGRLVLGDNINHIQPTVEVESFQCSFSHTSSPGRFFVDGGQLSLKDGKSLWKADTITWKGYRWSNVAGDVAFGDQGIEITVAKANFCSLHCKGSISTHAGTITQSFHFWTEEADLASALKCLWGKDARIAGKFLLDGDMWAEGKEDPLKEASQGSLVFIAKNGRIYRWTLLSQIFGTLNVIGFFEGKFPDFTKRGLPYDSFTIRGELRNGYIYLKEAVIDGPAMKMVGEGKIDLVKGETDIVVLVAPLKTIDTILHHIPIVGKIVTGKHGTFVSVPFRVKGPFQDPAVTLLPPEAVGSGLWGVLKRTLETPAEVLKAISEKTSSLTPRQAKTNKEHIIGTD